MSDKNFIFAFKKDEVWYTMLDTKPHKASFELERGDIIVINLTINLESIFTFSSVVVLCVIGLTDVLKNIKKD